MAESPYGKLSETHKSADCCNMDWDDQGGCCLEFCWVKPDSGLTCCDGFANCAHATLCFCIFGLCSASKMYASSMNQPCSIVNHCCLIWEFPSCVRILTRHNIRKKLMVGGSGWCGDIAMGCLCPYCSDMQMARALGRDGWDWTESISDTEWMVTP